MKAILVQKGKGVVNSQEIDGLNIPKYLNAYNPATDEQKAFWFWGIIDGFPLFLRESE